MSSSGLWILAGILSPVVISFFGYLRHREYLRTARHMSDRHGLAALRTFLQLTRSQEPEGWSSVRTLLDLKPRHGNGADPSQGSCDREVTRLRPASGRGRK